MGGEVIEDRFIHVESQIISTHLKRDHLLAAERRGKTTTAPRTITYDLANEITYQTVDRDDKMVSIQR